MYPHATPAEQARLISARSCGGMFPMTGTGQPGQKKDAPAMTRNGSAMAMSFVLRGRRVQWPNAPSQAASIAPPYGRRQSKEHDE